MSKNLMKIYPITDIYFEYIKADIDLNSGRKGAKSGKGFSSVMVGQKWAIEQLSQLATVHTRFGWQTSNLRIHIDFEIGSNACKNRGKKCQAIHFFFTFILTDPRV